MSLQFIRRRRVPRLRLACVGALGMAANGLTLIGALFAAAFTLALIFHVLGALADVLRL